MMEAVSSVLLFEDYENSAWSWPKWHSSSWNITSTYVIPTVTTVLYLVTVLALLPRIMAGLKPAKLTGLVTAYNLCQVIFAAYIIIRFFCQPELVKYFLSATMYASSHVVKLDMEKEIADIHWYYLMSKYVQYTDTVLFLIRGKRNQVTFLHVYHHANMAFSTWIYANYFRMSHTLGIVIPNEVEHLVMYSYYLLAGMGPALRPYLWWKRYITLIQMMQFIIVLIGLVIMVTRRCPLQAAYLIYTCFNTFTFLSLFAKFYKTSYKLGERKDE